MKRLLTLVAITALTGCGGATHRGTHPPKAKSPAAALRACLEAHNVMEVTTYKTLRQANAALRVPGTHIRYPGSEQIGRTIVTFSDVVTHPLATTDVRTCFHNQPAKEGTP